jgi:hypothetical protein
MIPLITEPETVDQHGLEERKRAALEHILSAWSDANDAGIEPEVVASAAIYAALADLVENMGADKVAEMVAGLPRRIRHGEFSVPRILQ